VDPTVTISYIESLQQPFTLNADQIIYLSDLGLGNPVINALVKKANSTATPSTAIQNVVINTAAAEPNPAAAPAAAAENPAPESTFPGANNVLLTNYLASTAGGAPIGIPGAPLAAAPAPVYGQPQPGPEAVVAQPAQRRMGGQLVLAKGLERALRHLAREKPRANGIDPYAVVPPFGGQRAGEIDHRALGSVVRNGLHPGRVAA
jgi:hypothetical protein